MTQGWSVSLGHPERDGRFVLQRRGDDAPSIYLSAPHADREVCRNALADRDGSLPMMLTQTHSRRVRTVPEEYFEGAEGDGLVTDARVPLGVTVGDCLPVFLYDSESDVYAVVHSGWRGTGIVVSALDAIRRLAGASCERVEAVIGPGIGRCCYAVPPERADLFSPSCVERRSGEVFLDLKQANLEILATCGVSRIRVVNACTQCDPRLGSYRREGSRGYRRMVAAIGYF